jgi:hypothetical protein
MNLPIPPDFAVSPQAEQAEPNSNLVRWLTDARTAEFFGDSFTLKADVLACLIRRGNLSDVARAHRLTRAAASKQARRARAIFGDMATLS